MQDKKQEILSQLEQGKITATEAFTMLNQLNETDDTPRSNGPQPQRESQIPPPPPPPPHDYHSSFTTPDWVEDLVGDISGAVQDVVESIKDMNIGASISEFMSGTYGHHENTLFFTSNPISQGVIKLTLIGKSARVSVTGYGGNTIRVQCKYNARRPDAQVVFHEEDGTYQVMYDESLIRSMEIVCEVPHVMIKNAHIASKNGPVLVEDIQACALVLYTKNEKILASNITCAEFVAQNHNEVIRVNTLVAQNVHMETTNAKIQVENVHANNVGLKTTNDRVKMAYMDVQNLQIHTTNTSLKLDKFLHDFNDWGGQRTLEAHTTNGSISFSAPRDVGLKVEAHAKGGKVVCKSYDMYFSEVGREYARGTNSNYELGGKKLDVQLVTTNASVKIRD
ncbi:MAG: DUF4097 family beta strand repeat-containing protein [Firmicutes bacterium]|nr:DUF4097 family beta strand repeat-containing protein [Bacillota bacterium]